KTVGMPFIAVSRVPYGDESLPGRNWNFAVREGEPLEYRWPLSHFPAGGYHLEVRGPNGFYREFKGEAVAADHRIMISNKPDTQTLVLVTAFPGEETVEVKDLSYRYRPMTVAVKDRVQTEIPLANSNGWYDF